MDLAIVRIVSWSVRQKLRKKFCLNPRKMLNLKNRVSYKIILLKIICLILENPRILTIRRDCHMIVMQRFEYMNHLIIFCIRTFLFVIVINKYNGIQKINLNSVNLKVKLESYLMSSDNSLLTLIDINLFDENKELDSPVTYIPSNNCCQHHHNNSDKAIRKRER